MTQGMNQILGDLRPHTVSCEVIRLFSNLLSEHDLMQLIEMGARLELAFSRSNLPKNCLVGSNLTLPSKLLSLAPFL